MNCIIKANKEQVYENVDHMRKSADRKKVVNFVHSPHMNKDLKRANELIYWESTWWLRKGMKEEKFAPLVSES